MGQLSPDFGRSNRLIRDLLLVMFRPLVRILLRYSVSFSTVVETLKWVYVHEAADWVADKDMAPRSAVAMHTGLCRKEVKKYVEMQEAPYDENPRRHERLPSIVTGWLRDPRFSDCGSPKTLALTGNDSFQTLVKEYGADISHAVIARELVQREVAEKENGCIRLRVRHLGGVNPVSPDFALSAVVRKGSEPFSLRSQRFHRTTKFLG